MSRPVLLYVGGVVAVGLTVCGVGTLALTRNRAVAAQGRERQADVDAGPHVRLATVTRGAALRRVELQGEAKPYASVTLYAKISGYLKEIRVDKGDRVQPNQVLAVIESPELDRQVDSALADARYKRADAKRIAALLGPGVVSEHDVELAESAAKMSEAAAAGLETQRSYELVRAPFAGVVTSRYADPGALVQNAANAQTSALPICTVSQGTRLRVSVYVDQRDAAAVRVGDAAEVQLADGSAEKLIGRIARLSSELDLRSRTMLVEVDLDNKSGRIVPGSFVQVALQIKAAAALEVPSAALVLRGKQAFVPVVAADDTVTYRKVTLAGDDGATARVQDGLKEGERVALNLGDAVVDGARVRPVVSPAARATKAP